MGKRVPSWWWIIKECGGGGASCGGFRLRLGGGCHPHCWGGLGRYWGAGLARTRYATHHTALLGWGSIFNMGFYRHLFVENDTDSLLFLQLRGRQFNHNGLCTIILIVLLIIIMMRSLSK